MGAPLWSAHEQEFAAVDEHPQNASAVMTRSGIRPKDAVNAATAWSLVPGVTRLVR
jgi:hypothetical protein